MPKPILCVDFDGVIHSYTSGWKGACQIPDPPVKGALPWLWKASEWWDVQIYSSRTKEPGAIEAMRVWLFRHANLAFGDDDAAERFLSCITFPEQKPPAVLTIDDRAITFEGEWSELDPCALLDFKPWNKRPVGAFGAYSQGQLNDDDQGDLRMAVAYDPVDGIVRVDFGEPVAWLGLPPENAIALGEALIRRARERH